MERKWARSGFEPLLTELMSDPIVHLLMLGDHITSADVWKAIDDYWERRCRLQVHRSVVDDKMAAPEIPPFRQ